ncbi:paraquat-inducible protein A [Parendozoicomonas haliclonae]|nr:paraquat-inducible protein A [Parendozoicomonas haliclonae]
MTYARGIRVRCPRCAHVIYPCRNTLNRCRAALLAALILFFPANIIPVLTVEVGFSSQTSTISTGVFTLWREGMPVVAFMVLLFAIIVPFLRLVIAGLALLPPQVLKRRGLLVMRWHHILEDWGMVDIFMLGVLVAIVKLNDFATITVERGFWFLAAMMVMELRVVQLMPVEQLWQRYHKFQVQSQ